MSLSLSTIDFLHFQNDDGKGQRVNGDIEIKLPNIQHDVIVPVAQKVGQGEKQ